jgi:hypothetical protein
MRDVTIVAGSGHIGQEKDEGTRVLLFSCTLIFFIIVSSLLYILI